MSTVEEIERQARVKPLDTCADCSASGGTSSRLFPSGLDLGTAPML